MQERGHELAARARAYQYWRRWKAYETGAEAGRFVAALQVALDVADHKIGSTELPPRAARGWK